jgi:hypothetical protein
MPGLGELLQGLQGAPQGGMPAPPPQGMGGMPPQGGMGASQVPMPSVEQVMMIIQMLKNMGVINDQALAQMMGAQGMGGQPMGGMGGNGMQQNPGLGL